MRSRRRLRSGVLLAASCAALPLAIPLAPSSASAAPRRAPAATMIVFVRATDRAGTAQAARARAIESQSSVAGAVAALGGTVLARTLVPDAVTVRLTAAQAAALAADPAVASVLPDSVIPGPQPRATTLAPASSEPSTARRAPHGSCGTLAHPQLNPEAISVINAPAAWAAGATGKGVKVAFLADGLDVTNVDFRRSASYATSTSPRGSRVIPTYVDFSGDGTAAPTGGAEAFGDASSIAAQGNAVYDLSRVDSGVDPLPTGCDARIVGVAPGATLLGLKVYSATNNTTASGFVQAIGYAVANGAKVINESFGGSPFPDGAADVIKAANDDAVAAGVTVVASSGDAGVSGTIGSPSTDPLVLSVGATTTFRAYLQTAFGGINVPGASGAYIDNNISSLSSGGVAQDAKTVNLVAPGDLGWALCSANKHLYAECAGKHLQDFGGTSQAAPLTAGAAADVIGAYAASHHGTYPAPELVGRILTSTARDVLAPADQQGAGLLDVAAAVAMARSITGTKSGAPRGGILASTSQLDLTGTPSSGFTSSITLTNTSGVGVGVTVGARSLRPVGAVSGAVTLIPSRATRQPKFRIWSGATEIYQRASFSVPAGLDRVALTAAYPFSGQTSLVHIALLDPKGRYAGYSLPQGIGDYSRIEVARPLPGRWTAVVFTAWNGWRAGVTGTAGRVVWRATMLRYRAVGAVTPRASVLLSGGSEMVSFHGTFPASPGDTTASITVASGSHVATIPVILRTVIAMGPNGGTFQGALTGGNGRGGAPGQTSTYTFSVPPGLRDLDASLALAHNHGAGQIAGDQVIGMLIDPTGQIAAYDSNYTANSTGPTVTRFLSLYKATPVSGVWQLVLDWAQPGAGVAAVIPFSGAIRFNQVSELTTLPDSPSTAVSSSGVDFSVQVTNNGVAPMIVSPDARLASTVVLTLADLAGAPSSQPIATASNLYYVPTETSAITVSVAGTQPVTFDLAGVTGDPDLSPTMSSPYMSGSVTPSLATLTYAPPTGVSPGMWGTNPARFGPFGAHGSPGGTETTTATVTTRAFDPTVTSPTTDTVEALANGLSPNPDVIDPGTAQIITVHIAPAAPVGTVVSGTLFIDGLTLGSVFGATIVPEPLFTGDIAAIPYQYKVGP